MEIDLNYVCNFLEKHKFTCTTGNIRHICVNVCRIRLKALIDLIESKKWYFDIIQSYKSDLRSFYETVYLIYINRDNQPLPKPYKLICSQKEFRYSGDELQFLLIKRTPVGITISAKETGAAIILTISASDKLNLRVALHEIKHHISNMMFNNIVSYNIKQTENSRTKRNKKYIGEVIIKPNNIDIPITATSEDVSNIRAVMAI